MSDGALGRAFEGRRRAVAGSAGSPSLGATCRRGIAGGWPSGRADDPAAAAAGAAAQLVCQPEHGCRLVRRPPPGELRRSGERRLRCVGTHGGQAGRGRRGHEEGWRATPSLLAGGAPLPPRLPPARRSPASRPRARARMVSCGSVGAVEQRGGSPFPMPAEIPPGRCRAEGGRAALATRACRRGRGHRAVGNGTRRGHAGCARHGGGCYCPFGAFADGRSARRS